MKGLLFFRILVNFNFQVIHDFFTDSACPIHSRKLFLPWLGYVSTPLGTYKLPPHLVVIFDNFVNFHVFPDFQLIPPVLLALTNYCFPLQTPRSLKVNLKLDPGSEHTLYSLHMGSLQMVVQVGFGYFLKFHTSVGIIRLEQCTILVNNFFLRAWSSQSLAIYDMPTESFPPSLVCAI